MGVSSTCRRVLVEQPTRYPPEGEWGRAESVFGWLEPSTQSMDTVTTLGLSEVWSRQFYEDRSFFRIPWGAERSTYSERHDDLVVGHGRTQELRKYGPSGVLKAVVRWEQDPEPVSQEDRDRYSELRQEFLARMPVHPETSYWFPDLGEYPWLPSHKLLFDRILLDDERESNGMSHPNLSVGSTAGSRT